MDIQEYQRLTDQEKMEFGLSQARAASSGATIVGGSNILPYSQAVVRRSYWTRGATQRGSVMSGYRSNMPPPKIETLKIDVASEENGSAGLTIEDLRQMIFESVDQALENLDRS